MVYDEVHVRIASLDVGGARLEGLAADLSPAERERSSRLRFERDRRRFVAAHGLLRRVPAQSLDCEPRAELRALLELPDDERIESATPIARASGEPIADLPLVAQLGQWLAAT